MVASESMIFEGGSSSISYGFFDFLFFFSCEGCNFTGGFTAYAIATQVTELAMNEAMIISINSECVLVFRSKFIAL